jgi:uncharacterized protein GlcG (DUF336 family)
MRARAGLACGAFLLALGLGACRDEGGRDALLVGGPGCTDMPGEEELRELLAMAPDSGEAGGLFGGRHEWAAVVDRSGVLCNVVTATDSPGLRWPGSRTIAMAKAFTANGFSTNMAPVSTARLYTLSQPGRPLYGAGAANPFDPSCLNRMGVDLVCGGTIVFGGGLPLYRDSVVVGGLGVSGDTPCADHEIAKRMRAMLDMIPPGGNFVDDIVYAVGGPSSVFAHPVCRNTWKNGQKVGDAPPQPGYGYIASAPVEPQDTVPPVPGATPPDTVLPPGVRPDTATEG